MVPIYLPIPTILHEGWGIDPQGGWEDKNDEEALGNTLMTAIDSMRSLMTEQERQADLACRLQSDIKVSIGDVSWKTSPSVLSAYRCIPMKVLDAARRRLEDNFDAKSRECDTVRGKMKAMEDRQASS